MYVESTEKEQKAFAEIKQQEIAAHADISEQEESETKLNEIDKQAEQFEDAKKDRDVEWKRNVMRVEHSKREQRENQDPRMETGGNTGNMESWKGQQCGIMQDILKDWKKRKKIQESRN